MKVFSVSLGLTKIEFAVYVNNGKFSATVNDMILMEHHDYEVVRNFVLENMEVPQLPTGVLH